MSKEPVQEDHLRKIMQQDRTNQQQRTVHEHPSHPQGHGQNQQLGKRGRHKPAYLRGRRNPKGQRDQVQGGENALQPQDEEGHA